MSDRGKYIVLEGDEGAGKTTQLERVKQRLEDLGHPTKIVREPGGDPFGEELRKLLKHAVFPISPIAETLAFSAARANMIAQVVKPHLDSGTWVLSDRSYASTIVYQGLGKGLHSDTFMNVVEYAVSDAKPDLIIIVDISFEESLKRQKKRGLQSDRFDLGEEFRKKINRAYHQLNARKSSSVQVIHIDGEGTVDEVEGRIMQALGQFSV